MSYSRPPPPSYAETILPQSTTRATANQQPSRGRPSGQNSRPVQQQQQQQTQQQYVPYQVAQTVGVPAQYVYQILPEEMQPNDYLMLSTVVASCSSILNVTSMIFSLPALVCSSMAFKRNMIGDYATAKRLGNAAVVLCILCVSWVMICGIVTVSMVAACVYDAGPLCY